MSSGLFNSITIKQLQKLQLNPQLMQSMMVLCMNTEELIRHIDELYRENPCIEKSEAVIPEEYLHVIAEFRNFAYAGGRAKAESGQDWYVQEAGDRFVDDYIELLNYSLKSQLESIELGRTLRAVCVYLIDNLEDNGWLTAESVEAVREIGVPEELLERALEVIKGLEPAGVGAADLSEFIALQLRRNYPEEKLALRIAVPKYMDALAKQQYQSIAGSLKVSVREVEKAAELISSLNHNISIGYTAKKENNYIRPDVYILSDIQGDLQVLVNEYDTPVITVSEKYIQLYKTTDDPELKAYLREKINQTHQLINSMERRESSLKRCMEHILEVQQDFFEGNTKTLKPMTMVQAAEALGINVSTVSRCAMHKYVQCRAGVFPIRYFFSKSLHHIAGSDYSAQGAKIRIAEMIAAEDRKAPLSDSAICSRLNELGFEVKRRTVAKYREELLIPEYRIRRNRMKTI